MKTRCENIMKTVLDWADVTYGNCGIDRHADIYSQNKHWLIDLLRKHPNWNEDALAVIIPDVKESAELDPYVAKQTLVNLVNYCKDITGKPIYINTDSDHWIHKEVSAPLAQGVNEKFDVRATEGQKTTRMIRKYLQKHGVDINSRDFTSVFQPYADAINVNELNRYFILSVNPGDYLTMSYGDGWSSCHIINSDLAEGESYSGCYKAGTLSYMTDECTVVGYTLSCLPEDMSTLPMERKKTRQVFMYNGNHGVLLQSRLYPYTSDDDRRKTYRNIVQKIISTCCDIRNHWTKVSDYTDKLDTYFKTARDSLHYRDYETTGWHPTISILTTKNPAPSCVTPSVIGEHAICLDCGYERHGGDADVLCCDDCNDDGYICARCGCRHDEDEGRFIDGDFYCDNCCFYCSYHEEYEPGESFMYVRRFGNVCENAIDSGNFSTCSICGEYIWDYSDYKTVTNDGEVFCEDCVRSHVACCDKCGDIFRMRDMTKINGAWYCDDCIEDMKVNSDADEASSDS